LVDVATGSLGQGLSIGVGMALASKKLLLENRIFVLLGDGEMEEGSNWEALQVASYYKLDNLVGIIDASRLEQEGETMLGHDTKHGATILQRRVESFGWKTIVVDGHSIEDLQKTFEDAHANVSSPTMIVAITEKGKGISFLEGKPRWHGKVLSEEQLQEANVELGNPQPVQATCMKPKLISVSTLKSIEPSEVSDQEYLIDDLVSTRKAYGTGLIKSAQKFPTILSIDAGVANSTFAETFKRKCPNNYYEMFIAEQNMVGVALGLSKFGFIPFASTFGAFMSRAHDQIRMAAYSRANVKFVGSHVGVSIGQDGPSQMGLEDIALFRSVIDSVVLYPSDANSTEALINEAAKYDGIVYLRTTRAETPVLYSKDESFQIGGSKIIKQTDSDKVVIFAAGITLHESLKAHDELIKQGISICVIDVYSVKPLDEKTIKHLALEYENVIVVEDHFKEGGLGEAIASVLVGLPVKFIHLAVTKIPRSGKPDELLDYEEISSSAIVKKVKELL